MPGRAIPEQKPVSDPFHGAVVQFAADQVLITGTVPDEAALVIASGELTIRYGVRLLGKPHLSFVPGLVALDYGDMLIGEEAWTFLFKKSNLHPRSDVVGYLNDGQADMMPVKKLDLTLSPEVLVYFDSGSVPVARPTALIAPDLAGVPKRICEYLPHFTSLAEWQAANAHD